MEKVQLKTELRETNNRTAKPLYRQGLIPVELYGHNVANVHLSVNQIEFEKVLRKAGESSIVELVLPDGGIRNVLIQDVERHYLSTAPIHVDFYEVKMTEKLTATVQIEFTGESHAVKALGGTLVKALNEVEVECLPGDLPHQFDVDISVLDNFDKQILVKDLIVSDKVEIKADADEMVATVQPPRDMEAEEANNVVDEAAAVAAVVGAEPDAAEGAEGDKEKKE
ncbi:MAG TPA: 50S ribosomal protein L25 [Patescibacteria group bacterium]|jgi:large subunit ribosomal protein L25|nr:50S ribosomal protein L25 [Patescibacteria group bacterium]